MFELYMCPGDDVVSMDVAAGKYAIPCGYTSASYPGARWENYGTSYDYLATVFCGPSSLPNDPVGLVAPVDQQTGLPCYDADVEGNCWQGLWGFRYDDVKDPARQVITSDYASAAWGQNYHGDSVHYNGCDYAAWLFHGTSRDRPHNMSHVDGHVKTHTIPFLPWGSSSGGPWMAPYSNDQYQFSMQPYAWE